MEPPTTTNSNNPRVKWNLKMIISAIQIILGLSAFFCFIFFENYGATIWGFISFLLAMIAFILHYYDNNNRLSEKYSAEDLGPMQIIGVAGFVGGLAGIAWNVFAMEYYDLHTMPIKTSPVIRMVCAFMTMINGLILIIFTYRYGIKIANS